MMKISKNKIFPVYIYVFGSTVILWKLIWWDPQSVTMICVADSASTYTILKDKKLFSFLIMQGSDVNTISGSAKLIEGSGRANILLPGRTKIHIDDALYSTKSQRN